MDEELNWLQKQKTDFFNSATDTKYKYRKHQIFVSLEHQGNMFVHLLVLKDVTFFDPQVSACVSARVRLLQHIIHKEGKNINIINLQRHKMIWKLNKSIQFGQATYTHSAVLFFLIVDLFVRPLVVLFWTSCDVCPGFYCLLWWTIIKYICYSHEKFG